MGDAMKVLFLTLAYPEHEDASNLYVDLMQEFKNRGDEVFVACQREKRFNKSTEITTHLGIDVLRIKTGNITKTSFIEKGVATLLLEFQFISAIKQYYRDNKFDLVLYSTPPITFEKVVSFLKRRDHCKTYLLLKDIFPQNAVDLELIKEEGIIHRYFRKKEKRLYSISDHIGCMSKANVDFVIKHNEELSSEKIEICPNSILPVEVPNLDQEDQVRIREQYQIPANALLLIYGGNLGKPQGVDFLLDVMYSFKDNLDLYFFIVGSGTEFVRIQDFLLKHQLKNAQIKAALPKNEFDMLLCVSDIGLVFLNPKFTIPNFPSRMNSYMEYGIPIIAATDIHTDIKEMFLDAGCGLWSESGDLKSFQDNVLFLYENKIIRENMGKSGRRYLEQNYCVGKSYDIICAHFK